MKFLGETALNIEETEYADWTQSQWCLLWLEKYYGIGGEHHKTWLNDQIARILHGTKVSIELAKWDDDGRIVTEERFNLCEATKEYHDWVTYMKSGEDGEDTYSYDVGIAP